MRVRNPALSYASLPTRYRPRPTRWPIHRPRRRHFSTTLTKASNSFSRSDFGNQSYTSAYDPSEPLAGPLGGTSNVGAPKITPRRLKEFLDQYVVGQERAKKVLSTAVYNHYQRIQELQRQEEEHQALMAQKARRETGPRHPIEGILDPNRGVDDPVMSTIKDRHLTPNLLSEEYPGQQPIAPASKRYPHPDPVPTGSKFSKLGDTSRDSVTLEKSNVLLLGPSGVGKTLMVKTLANVLDVPFSISDCTPLTQAGYIGDDVEVVIQRLLAAANYDVAKAEMGIVCLDEIDKIATAKVTHGKDVGGEGVQQALLKIIEGTSVTVQAKGEKVSPSTGRDREKNGGSIQSPVGGMGLNQPPASGKNDSYSVKTDNILFICTGAFIGLHKLVMERMAQGSMGFNAPLKTYHSDTSKSHDTNIKVDSSNSELFKDHLPYWHVHAKLPTQYAHPASPPRESIGVADSPTILNSLDLLTPSDLQKFGFIPELIGRVPVHCAVSPLSEAELARVLTEPRNALATQFQEMMNLSGIELKFTKGAIRAIAQRASRLGTGARALRGILEALLSESMFACPGSTTKFILITEDVVEQRAAPVHLDRGQRQLFENLLYQHEDEEAQGTNRTNQGGIESKKKASGAL